MRFRWRWWYLVVPVALILLLVTLFNRGESDESSIDFGDVLAAARDGQLDEITVSGQKLKVRFRDEDTTYVARISRSTDLIDALQANDITVGGDDPGSVAVRFEGPSDASGWLILLVWASLVVGFLVVLYFAVKRATRIGVQEGLASREQRE